MFSRGIDQVESQRDEHAGAKSIAPGKRTLTASLPVQRSAQRSDAPAGPAADGGAVRHGHEDPFAMHLVGAVQRAASSPAASSDEGVHAAAARGTSGPGGELPHAAAIQRAFGSFDISGIRSHTDDAAAEGAAAMGARAFAAGNHVAFAPGEADLHTAAHEAAHVIQQRAGVQLAGGVGAEGDAFERHADAVADKVVAGESAEELLAAGPSGAPASAGGMAVQRAAKASAMGTFTDEKYELDGTKKLKFLLKFTPGDQVDAIKIGLTQSLKDTKDGVPNAIDAAARSRKSADGHAVDRLSNNNNPIYGAPALGPNQGLEATAESNNPTTAPTELDPDKGRNATYELGHRINTGGAWDVKDAGLHDAPTIIGGPSSSKEFESAAVALDGPQKGTYYGSVRWGWRKDAAGVLSEIPFDLVSMGVPSKEFLGAATMWNAGRVRGKVAPIADNTPVYGANGAELYRIDTDVEMQQEAAIARGDVYHLRATIVSAGPHKDDEVYVKTADVEDMGDGAALVRLPVPEVKVLSRNDSLYKVAWKSDPKQALPQGTRVKVSMVRTAPGMSKLEILDGPDTGKIGWTSSDALVNE
jgi:Domain of unknown function (DUF4157)